MDGRMVFVEERLSLYLLVLGVWPSLKGYAYLKEGVKKILQDPSKKYNLRSKLYKELALELNESCEGIESGLRNASKIISNKNGVKEFENRFRFYFQPEKPTPRVVLSLLSEALKIELKRKEDEFKKLEMTESEEENEAM